MVDEKLAAPCGLYCRECRHHGKKCRGCGHEVGRPFWADHVYADICNIYNCCCFQRKHEHCGLCSELPCEVLIKFHDPDLTDFGKEISIKVRQQDLLIRKKLGTEKWIKLREKKHKKLNKDE